MKDKKFKPAATGKSYNFDMLTIGKKPFAKDVSQMRAQLHKNKLFTSNDLDSERSKLFITKKT